ncbi:MAG: mechanosensitive ion channel family protein [Phycisphaerales bacterium]|nr:mechanosensitive ion channel family protein [Phycisphaerales bacterium]
MKTNCAALVAGGLVLAGLGGEALAQGERAGVGGVSAVPAPRGAGGAGWTHWTEMPILGNPVSAWLVCVGVAVVVYLVLTMVRGAVVSRLAKVAAKTTTRVDDLVVDVLRGIRRPVVLVVAVFAGMAALSLPVQVENGARMITVVAVAVQLLISSRRVIDFALEALLKRAVHEDGKPDETLASSMGVLRVVVFGAVVAVVILLALDNLGVQVTPLIAGLGIGGIAVALAAQNILADLFASVSILLDKPFVVGDSVAIGDKSGVVERIGIKTTRLRTPQGEELVCANNDLLGSRLHNYKRMSERRVVHVLGVRYETAVEKLEAMPGWVKGVVEGVEGLRFDRCHLVKLNTYSVDFELVYFVRSADFLKHIDAQQLVLLGVMKKLAAEGVEFAYPVQVQMNG